MIWIVLLIAVLLGLSAGGAVWFGLDLVDKVHPKIAAIQEKRMAAKAAVELAAVEVESGEADGTEEETAETAETEDAAAVP